MSRDRCCCPACEPEDDPRQAALDLHITIAETLPTVRPLFFLSTTDAAGRPVFHTAVPVHDLAALVAEAQADRADAEDLHVVNQDLRRQRDDWRDRYHTLLALTGYRPGQPRR